MRLFILTFCVIYLFPFFSAWGVDKSGVKPSVLSLPSGPGSIEGLGESFEPQLNSGTASYRVKLTALPGRAGFAPELAIAYNSGKGNGPFGLGWDISLPFLSRQTDKGFPWYTDWPNGDGIDNDQDNETDEYDEFDILLYSNGEELVPMADGAFRCENESEFIKFERSGQGWEAKGRDGTTMWFGTVPESRIQNQDGNIFKWLLEKQQDTNGNLIQYTYEKLDDTLQRYCTSMTYNFSDAGSMTIVLNYETRPDVITDFRPRYELKTAFRCKEIKMMERERLIRAYKFDYEQTSSTQALSLLRSITQVGSDNISLLPPATFGYTRFDSLNSAVIVMPSAPNLTLSNGNIDLCDINSDGLPDILDTTRSPQEYFINKGPDPAGEVLWSTKQYMTTTLYKPLISDQVQLADMDGDGRTDLLDMFGAVPKYYKMNKDAFWELAGYVFDAPIGINFSDPNVKMVDINNDKLIDVLRTDTLDYVCWLNLKQGVWSRAFVNASPNSQVKFDRDYIKLADMNGDRMEDLVWIQDETCAYYPNMGLGKFGDRIVMDNPPTGIYDQQKLVMADVNGDGMNDVIYASSPTKAWINLGLNPQNHLKGQFAEPFSFNGPLTSTNTVFRQADVNGNGSKDILWNTYPGGGDTFTFLDFSPTEQPNQLKIITNGIGRTTTVSYRSSVEDMIRDRDANPARTWPENIPFPVPVVAQIDINDGINTYTTTVEYHDGYYDGEEKEFRGFAAAEKKEIGDASAPDLILSYVFHTGLDFDTGEKKEALKGKPLDLEAQNSGQEVFYGEVYAWGTKPLDTIAPGETRKVIFPYQSQKVRHVIEKNATPVNLEWDYQYDDYGNMIRQMEYGRLDGDWGDERETLTSYTAQSASGKTKWVLDKPCEEIIKDGNGEIAAWKKSYYDNLGLTEVSQGNLTRVEEWWDENHSVISIRNDYDAYGNIIATYDPLYGQQSGHYRQFTYDPIFHTFPIEEKIYTGTPVTLIMAAEYDYGFGAITSSKDFNGYISRYGYDTFGRLISIIKPPDSSHTIKYDYQLAQDIGGGKLVNWVETRQRDNSSGEGFLHSRTFYDGLGRKIMTRTEGENAGEVVVSDTVKFNARQLPWKKYLPYFDSGGLGFVEPSFISGYMEHFYDAQGREIKMNQPDGSFSTTTYAPLEKTIMDEEQTRVGSSHQECGMKYVEDGLQDKDGNGRLREVYEIVKLSNTGEPLPGTVSWKTTYTYNTRDDLTGYIDSQNNRKTILYDWLGRKTEMEDPDRGRMEYGYDDAGNLIQTKDNKNQIIQYHYDGVNRLTEEYYGNQTPDVVYHYDFPYGDLALGDLWQGGVESLIACSILNDKEYYAEFDKNSDGVIDAADVVTAAKSVSMDSVASKNTKGYLSWVKDLSGEEHNSYDSRGRVEWVIKRIADTSADNMRNFYAAFEYDSMDRVTRLTYPDGSLVTYKYNTRGLLESVPQVIDQYDYNPSGQNALLKLACGMTTTYDYDNRLRLSRLHTIRNRDNLPMQDLAYTYDAVSNITAITDGRTNTHLETMGQELGISGAEARKFNATQSFFYDSLYRLIEAKNTAVYGAIAYQYDRVGNMVKKQAGLLEPDPLMDLGVMISGGGETWNRSIKLPGVAPGPHAVTGTEKGPSGPMAYTYDDNGNMITDRGMAFFWDYKDRMTGLTNGTKTAQYLYDYTDTRKKKQIKDASAPDSESVVIYIDKFSETRDGRLVKYVYAGNNRVAKATASLDSHAEILPTCFYLQDHLGSNNLTLSASTTVLEQMANYPYGTPRRQIQAGDAAECAAKYGFTGKEKDVESGLQYFEARYYDSVVGKFPSVDPLGVEIPNEWQIDPQKLNIYAYAENNSTNFIDNDGRFSLYVHTETFGHLGIQTVSFFGKKSNYDFGRYQGKYKSSTYKGPNILKLSEGKPSSLNKQGGKEYNFKVSRTLDNIIAMKFQNKFKQGLNKIPSLIKKQMEKQTELKRTEKYMQSDWGFTENNCVTFTISTLKEVLTEISNNEKYSASLREEAKNLLTKINELSNLVLPTSPSDVKSKLENMKTK